jgi:uncharacterized protein (DUF924 family)
MHTAVLDYWFAGDLETAYETKWFVQAGSAAQLALDADIRTRFGELLASAERGELDGAWSRTPQAALALIVLLDQLSRHVHRGDAAAVAANDVRALRTTRMGSRELRIGPGARQGALLERLLLCRPGKEPPR